MELKLSPGMNMTYLRECADEIVKLLEGKVFDIVSFHSAYDKVFVVEERRLRSSEVTVKDTSVKILLFPSRNLSFDLKEDPEISIESKRQIRIVRKLSYGVVLTRIILINPDIELMCKQ